MKAVQALSTRSIKRRRDWGALQVEPVPSPAVAEQQALFGNHDRAAATAHLPIAERQIITTSIADSQGHSQQHRSHGRSRTVCIFNIHILASRLTIAGRSLLLLRLPTHPTAIRRHPLR